MSGQENHAENNFSCTPEELEAVRETVRLQGESPNLVRVLLEVQQRIGYLPREGMREIAGMMGISETSVYSVATFYNRFRFVPPGRHRIQVCMGTACHVKRGGIILDSWKRRLGIDDGAVTADREYSLDRVDCVGCCAMAPVTVVDDQPKGKMTPASVDGIILQHDIINGREKKAGSPGGRAEENDTSAD